MKRTSVRFASLTTILLIALFTLTSAAQAAPFGYTNLYAPNNLNDPNWTPMPLTARGVNDSGEVVGYYENLNQDTQAFLYNDTTGTYTTLDDPHSNLFTYAYGINNNGVVVGYFNDLNSGLSNGFVYNTANGVYTTLDDTAGQETYAHDINDNGDIVGTYLDLSGTYHGFLYNGSSLHFTTIDPPKSVYTQAYGIDNNGDIVGYYKDSSGNYHGFLYNGSTKAYTTLDDPLGIGNTFAYGINDVGDIIGDFEECSANQCQPYGFLYNRSAGAYTTLEASDEAYDPSKFSTSIYDINNTGDMAGRVTPSGGTAWGLLGAYLWWNATPTGGGWYYLSPFGAFTTTSSTFWIYHQTLGWLYPAATSTDSLWFYDPQWDGTGGWWWSGSSLFPWVYSATEGEWLYYDAKDSTPGTRWFFTASGQASTH